MAPNIWSFWTRAAVAEAVFRLNSSKAVERANTWRGSSLLLTSLHYDDHHHQVSHCYHFHNLDPLLGVALVKAVQEGDGVHEAARAVYLRVQCALCSVQFAVCRVQCVIFSVH